MIVQLHNDAWKMTIDITYVCENAGKRDRWYDERGQAHSFIPFTLIHARKIFRLIKEYADVEDLLKADNYISEFEDRRIIEQWEKA